jgi:uncharacterized protein YwlG (UPF0340 family)
MTVSAEAWYDDDAGPLVRLYARVGSRTTVVRDDLELTSIVNHVPGGPAPDDLSADQQAALRMARRPVSLSEIAAHLGLPVGATRLMLGHLREAGLVTVRRSTGDNQAAHQAVLQRVLGGLRSL